MAKKKKRKGLRGRVDDEVQVRYGPQRRALRDLLDEAVQTLSTTVATEEGAAQGVRAAVNAAKPQVKKIYADAHGSQDQANSDVQRDLSMLSSAADPYKAVSAREAGGAKRRLAESLAGASKELVDREQQAEQGRAYAVSNAVRTFNTDQGKIKKERLGLAEDIGSFASATRADFKDAAAKEKATQRKENRDYQLRVDALGLDVEAESRQQRKDEADITGVDPTTGKPTAGERERRRKAKAKKGPKFTAVQLRDARAQWKKGGLLLDVIDRGLKKKGGLTTKTGNAAVGALTRKGIPEPLARGVVQTRLYGGVRAKQRKFLQHNYGLKPKVRSSRRKAYAGLPPVVRGILE